MVLDISYLLSRAELQKKLLGVTFVRAEVLFLARTMTGYCKKLWHCDATAGARREPDYLCSSVVVGYVFHLSLLSEFAQQPFMIQHACSCLYSTASAPSSTFFLKAGFLHDVSYVAQVASLSDAYHSPFALPFLASEDLFPPSTPVPKDWRIYQPTSFTTGVEGGMVHGLRQQVSFLWFNRVGIIAYVSSLISLDHCRAQ